MHSPLLHNYDDMAYSPRLKLHLVLPTGRSYMNKFMMLKKQSSQNLRRSIYLDLGKESFRPLGAEPTEALTLTSGDTGRSSASLVAPSVPGGGGGGCTSARSLNVSIAEAAGLAARSTAIHASGTFVANSGREATRGATLVDDDPSAKGPRWGLTSGR